MNRTSLPPRWRAVVLFVAVGAAALTGGGASYGWASAGYLTPVVILVAVALMLVARRDTDAGAAVRHQVDERQAMQRLQIQALVGRVLAVAVAIAYLIAVATRATLWPYAALLAVMALSFVAAWRFYGEHGRGSDDDQPTPHRRSLLNR